MYRLVPPPSLYCARTLPAPSYLQVLLEQLALHGAEVAGLQVWGAHKQG